MPLKICKNFTTKSLLLTLKQHGFEVHWYTYMQIFFFSKHIFLGGFVTICLHFSLLQIEGGQGLVCVEI